MVRSWIGSIGRKGRNALAMSTLNTFPKFELAVILMYLIVLPKVLRPSTTPSSDRDRKQREEVKERARDEHAEHVPEVRAGGHLDVLDRVAEGLAPFDHAFLEHHQALLE